MLWGFFVGVLEFVRGVVGVRLMRRRGVLEVGGVVVEGYWDCMLFEGREWREGKMMCGRGEGKEVGKWNRLWGGGYVEFGGFIEW